MSRVFAITGKDSAPVLQLGMASDASDKEKPNDDAQAREKQSDGDKNEPLQPAREKTPEGEGNLRRRADWFQKRMGGS